VGKEVIFNKNQKRWKSCECCHQSKTLMSLLMSS
jgi:hypothetical protein